MLLVICLFISVVLTITISVVIKCMMSSSSDHFVSVDYEVHGYVQGVFFRDSTRRTARENGCVGWVKNSRDNTVVGQIQGPKKNIDFMKYWLSQVGSSSSRIDKCVFSNEKQVSELSHKTFYIDGEW